MNAAFVGSVRIGTVAKIAGEPPGTRWWAYASNERKQGFRTQRQAVAWLNELHNAEQEKT